MVTAEQLDKSSVFIDGVLVDLKISYWRGKAPLKPEDLGIDASSIPDIFSLGRKLIIPKESLAKFDGINARAAYLVSQFTFPFPTGHSRFVPYAVLPQVMEELTDLSKRFQEEVGKFVENYDEYRVLMVKKYPEHEAAILKAYIPRDRLHEKFGFSYALYEVTLPKGLKYRLTDARAVKEESEIRQKKLQEAEEEYRRQFQAQMDGFLSGLVGKLRESVAEAAVKVSERISKGEMITKGSLDSLRRTIERFKALNFVGDSEVEEALAKLEAAIPAEKVDSGTVQREFASAITTVMNTLVESDISTVTSEYKRKIRF